MKYCNFLVLGLRFDILPRNIKTSETILRFNNIFKKNSFKISLILIDEVPGSVCFHGMIYFQTPINNPITLEDAKTYIHSLECAFMIYHFCIAKDLSDNLSILPIGDELAKLKPPWTYKLIIDKNNDLIIPDNYPSLRFFEHEFKSYSIEDIKILPDMLKISESCWDQENIYNSASSLYKSIKDLGIDVCDWRDDNYDENFEEYVNTGTRESAFQNAFKSIESITGYLGPSSDRKKKIYKKLISVGINPKELVGYRNKEKILLKLVRYAEVRDKISAHGSVKKKNIIRLGQVIDLQSLARHIFLEKIFKIKNNET